MKHLKRPAWMGPRRTQHNKPVEGLTAASKAGSQQGYDPYDTVRTRKLVLDAWQAKPKRD
ncbi:MAG TPA: hypothetical protein VGM84_12540 [Steroidobacteraceae bacterium]|jgi:hypothetical protein